MSRIDLTDIDDPRIAVFRDLRTPTMERRERVFIAESMWLVRRLLASPFSTRAILVDERRLEEIGVEVPEHVPVYCVPNGLVERVVGFQFHRGVVAAGERQAPRRLIDLPGLDQPRWLLVAGVGIQDPENVGNILRSSAAFGAAGMVLGPACADPFSRRVLRVSMGASLSLPLATSGELFGELAILRQEFGAEIVATTLDARAEPLNRAPPAARCVLVFGSEGHGLEQRWLEFSDRRITIPMDPRADSLNVAVATGIFLYHFLRGAPE